MWIALIATVPPCRRFDSAESNISQFGANMTALSNSFCGFLPALPTQSAPKELENI